jgi:U3 small nucleolar RNA-associated protein 10
MQLQLIYIIYNQALGILSQTARGNRLVQNKPRKARKLKHSSLTASIKVDDNSAPCFSDLCLKILVLIDRGVDLDSSVKIAAISALEMLAKEYPSDNPTYNNCLATIIDHIGSGDAVTSASLCTAGALINVLGSKALPQLPLMMKNIMLVSHQVLCSPSGNYADGCTRTARLSNQTIAMLLSVLTTIEVIVEKLGEFVNPYLTEILDLVVLRPECGSQMDAKLDAKAADVRNVLTEKVPVCSLLIYLNVLLAMIDHEFTCFLLNL